MEVRPLQVGDVVMIYARPLEFDKPIGVAELLGKQKVKRKKEGLELWRVKFRGTNETDNHLVSTTTAVNIF